MIILDSGFALIFEGARYREEEAEAAGRDSQRSPTLFRRLIREKLEDEQQTEKMNAAELLELISHFIIHHFEPVANTASKDSEQNRNLRSTMNHLLTTRILTATSPLS